MSELVIREWLERLAETVARRDLDGHMALISKKVYVYGLPGDKTVDYAGWRLRRENELRKGLLAGLRHNGITIRNIGLRRVGFNTTETLVAASGHEVVVNKDMILEQEEDGRWRLVEEKILHWQVRPGGARHEQKEKDPP